jgi:hypothetical protein
MTKIHLNSEPANLDPLVESLAGLRVVVMVLLQMPFGMHSDYHQSWTFWDEESMPEVSGSTP